MRRKMNKKGVTPIIAVILLMMMTVAAAGAAFFWIVRVQSTLTGGTEQHIDTTISNIGSMAELAEVDYVNSSSKLRFVVRNLGSVPFTLTNSSTIMSLRAADGTMICNSNWANNGTINCASEDGCNGEIDVSSSQLVNLTLAGACSLSTGYTEGELIRYSVDFPGDATSGGTFSI